MFCLQSAETELRTLSHRLTDEFSRRPVTQTVSHHMQEAAHSYAAELFKTQHKYVQANPAHICKRVEAVSRCIDNPGPLWLSQETESSDRPGSAYWVFTIRGQAQVVVFACRQLRHAQMSGAQLTAEKEVSDPGWLSAPSQTPPQNEFNEGRTGHDIMSTNAAAAWSAFCRLSCCQYGAAETAANRSRTACGCADSTVPCRCSGRSCRLSSPLWLRSLGI